MSKTIQDWKVEFENLLNDASNPKFYQRPDNLVVSYSRRVNDVPHIKEVTRFIDDNNLYSAHKKAPEIPMSLRIYCILNDIHAAEDYPKCQMCGRGRTFESVTKGFKMTCGKRTCFQRHPETNRKRQATAKGNYGTLKEAYHTSAMKTYKEKTGFDNPSQNQEVQMKKIETSRKNWGTDFPWQSEKGKILQKDGIRKAYGVDNVSKVDAIKERKNQTCLKNWGYENPFQVPIIKERIIEAYRDKYKDFTITNVSQLLDVHLKKVESSCIDYKTPSGKFVKSQGQEHYVLDYLYEQYDEITIHPQPKLKICYIGSDGKDRVWFPDVHIQVEGKRELLIESKCVDFIYANLDDDLFERFKTAYHNYDVDLYVTNTAGSMITFSYNSDGSLTYKDLFDVDGTILTHIQKIFFKHSVKLKNEWPSEAKLERCVDGSTCNLNDIQHIVTKYISSLYKNIEFQPQLRIPYIDSNNQIHFWFPDVMIPYGDKTILIEGKDIGMLEDWVTYAKMTKYKLLGAFMSGYLPHLYVYDKPTKDIYLVEYLIDDQHDEAWLVHSLQGSGELGMKIRDKLQKLDFVNVFLYTSTHPHETRTKLESEKKEVSQSRYRDLTLTW